MMNEKRPSIMKEVLNSQESHWERTFLANPDMFGENPSEPAQKTAELFKKENRTKILELGGGQGRDTLFFAGNGFQVTMLDYSEEGIKTIKEKASRLGWLSSITAMCSDVRNPLPFADESFDACYSHMLFCMALTTKELEFISQEIRRVLKPGGISIYTVRHTGDPLYRKGIHRGEDMYEMGGFIVHYFSREQVEHLAKDYQIISIDEFEEGGLPKKLFRVALRKQ
jgi:ubiquinone/menaquinone biosynthesis C-methylase UbiE